jgi:hypothetical protein
MRSVNSVCLSIVFKENTILNTYVSIEEENRSSELIDVKRRRTCAKIEIDRVNIAEICPTIINDRRHKNIE